MFLYACLHNKRGNQEKPARKCFQTADKGRNVIDVGGACVPAVGTPQCVLVPEADSHWRSRSWWMTLSPWLQQPTWPPLLANKGDGRTYTHTHPHPHTEVQTYWRIISLNMYFSQVTRQLSTAGWKTKLVCQICLLMPWRDVWLYNPIIVMKCDTNTNFFIIAIHRVKKVETLWIISLKALSFMSGGFISL